MAARQLTDDEVKLFAANYVRDFNGTRACIELFKYDPKTAVKRAWEILQQQEVQAAISKACKRAVTRADWKAQDVLRKIQIQYKKASKKDDGRTALKALELYGKTLGMFLERVQHEGFEPLQIILPIAGKQITVTNGADHGRHIPTSTSEGTMQNLRVLPPDNGEITSGGVQALPATSRDDAGE